MLKLTATHFRADDLNAPNTGKLNKKYVEQCVKMY